MGSFIGLNFDWTETPYFTSHQLPLSTQNKVPQLASSSTSSTPHSLPSISSILTQSYVPKESHLPSLQNRSVQYPLLPSISSILTESSVALQSDELNKLKRVSDQIPSTNQSPKKVKMTIVDGSKLKTESAKIFDKFLNELERQFPELDTKKFKEMEKNNPEMFTVFSASHISTEFSAIQKFVKKNENNFKFENYILPDSDHEERFVVIGNFTDWLDCLVPSHKSFYG